MSARTIRPLGEQIIIRTIPVGSVGSIFIPDSAQGITMMGTKGDQRASDYLIDASLFDEILKVLRDDADNKRRLINRRIRPKQLLELAEKARAAPPAYDYQGATHFVEAEVIAVGPGRRVTDPDLMGNMVSFFEAFRDDSTIQVPYDEFCNRAQRPLIEPLQVQPGDHILYHPAVQRFDRQIDPILLGEVPQEGVEYFIIREGSVLGILDRKEQAA